MNKKNTKAIVLKRVDYGDSDRLITILTPDLGKLSLMAKGVRKVKSKLAGGIELFSIFDAGFLIGRSEVGRLISARLDEHYGNIIRDIQRVQLGYEILKAFDRHTADSPESQYFYLLCQLLRLLNEPQVPLGRIDLYFKSRLLALAGQAPNLMIDDSNAALSPSGRYSFDLPAMRLNRSPNGSLTADHLKLLRLLFAREGAQKIFNVNLDKQDQELQPLIEAMFQTYL